MPAGGQDAEMVEKEESHEGEEELHEDPPVPKVHRWSRVEVADAAVLARMEEDDVKMDRLIKLFQREVNKGFIFKELIPYCLFLLFMLVVVFVSRSEQYEAQVHRTVSGLSGTLLDNNMAMYPDLRFRKTFWDIANEDDWWRWVRQPLLTNIWPRGDDGGTLVNLNNKPLGFLVLRQQRVRRENCRQTEAFYAVAEDVVQYLPENCYPDYECGSLSNTLSAEAYGEGSTFVPLRSHPNNSLDFPLLSGKYEDYSCSGYSFVEKIPLDNATHTAALEKVQLLQTGRWIDEATRFLSAEIVFFNRNYDLFVYMAAFVEIHGGGLWHPDTRIVPFRFLSLKSAAGVVIFTLDIIVTFYFVYIFYRLVQTLVRNWKLHGEILSFFAFWNTYALADMVLFMVTYGFRWSFWHFTLQLGDPMFTDAGEQRDVERMWTNLARYGMLYEVSWNCYGFACALAIGGLFRFTQYNPRLFLLVETVERALGELLSVCLMMTVVVSAYGILGHLLFGYYLDEYQSFLAACGTLLRHLIGDFPDNAYYNLRDAQHSSFAAIVFLFSYTFIAWCILLNMILAIINESLAAVKAKAGQKDIAIMKWLQKQSNDLLERLARKRRSAERRRTVDEYNAARRKQEKVLTSAVYDKLKAYKASSKYREKLLKKQLKAKIDWTEEEWDFLESFMYDKRGEVYDKEADTPERQKLEMIYSLVNKIADNVGVSCPEEAGEKKSGGNEALVLRSVGSHK